MDLFLVRMTEELTVDVPLVATGISQAVELQGGTLLPSPFLDLRDSVATGGERGLLSLAFPPGSAASGRFFVTFVNAPDTPDPSIAFTTERDQIQPIFPALIPVGAPS